MTTVEKYLSIVVFFAVGLWCVLGATRMQKAAVRASEDLKFNPFRSYIRSPTYLIVARVFGVSVMLVAALLVVAFIYGKSN